jgi:hypothetical protein
MASTTTKKSTTKKAAGSHVMTSRGSNSKSSYTKLVLYLDHAFTGSSYKSGRYTNTKGAEAAAQAFCDAFVDWDYDGLIKDYVIEAEDISRDEFEEAFKAAQSKAK